MPSEGSLDALSSLALDAERWLASAGVSYAYVGGFALAFVGRARATRDVDAIASIDLERLDTLVAAARPFGFALLNSDGFEFARRTLVLRLRHNPTGLPLDLSLAFTPFEIQAIGAATRFPVHGGNVPVVRPQDLIVMKAFARRPQDLADIASVLDRHPNTDLRPVRRWLRELGTALDDPSYVTEFDQLVARWERTRPEGPASR